MKNVTNDFKTAIKTNGRQLDTKIKLNGIEFPKDMFNGITPSFNTNLFKTIMRGVEVDSNIYIPKLSELEIKSGVLVNDEYEYIDYGKYTAYKEPESNEDTKSWKATVYDRILDSMIDYDLKVEYPISVRDYWVSIFNRLNWNISGIPATFTNSTKMINQDVHSGIGYTFRDVLDELCTISAVFLMDISGNPTIVVPKETNQVIDETYLKDTNVTIGEKVFFNSLVFSRAEESDNIYRRDDTSIEENGLHEFRISDNQLLSTNDRVDYIDELWEYLKTFEYYSFDIDTVGVMFMEPVDMFTISANGNNYSTILLNDTTSITQGLTENMHSDVPEETETDYKYADKTDKKINQTYIIVDKQNQKIEQVVNEVGQYDNRITNVEQSVDSISQDVYQISNLIREKEGNSFLKLENTSNTELKTLSIKGDISLLFGNDGKTFGDNVPLSSILYPSSNLFGKNMNLIIEYDENSKEIINLPFTYLNYISKDICDEFIIDNSYAKIIRRVGINSSMQKYQLENEIIEDLGLFVIMIKEGNPKLYLQCFDNAIYKGSYMIKNEYTDSFATKVELNSSITQTKDEINLEVSKKVDNTEIISSINQSAEEISINANKISLEGVTTINDGFSVDEDGNMIAKNGEFKGGEIILYDDDSSGKSPKFKISTSAGNRWALINPYKITLDRNDAPDGMSGAYFDAWATDSFTSLMLRNKNISNKIEFLLYNDSSGVSLDITSNNQQVFTISDQNTYIKNLTYQTISGSSLASKKKNFELLQESGIDIICKSDIYKFNFKDEEDKCKKHIGIVIGDEYNYSKLITNVENTNVDLYSMISIAWKAIQEQTEKIEQLKKEIKKLKESE